MKPAKFFSSFFFVLGTILLVASILLCLLCRNREPKAQTVPQEAWDVSGQFTQALSDGDFERAGSLIYGQPDLGGDTALPSTAAARLWEAFRGSISVEAGTCCQEGSEIYRNVTVTTLDVPGVVKSIPSLAGTMTPEQGEEAHLLEAVDTALAAGERVSVSGRIRLIEDGGRWYVIPDKTVLSALSGGLG